MAVLTLWSLNFIETHHAPMAILAEKEDKKRPISSTIYVPSLTLSPPFGTCSPTFGMYSNPPANGEV